MKKLFIFFSIVLLLVSCVSGQSWPLAPINTTISPFDAWYFKGTNTYFNSFNIGGTTGTNGYIIWNGVRYDNPFRDISNDFTVVWNSLLDLNNSTNFLNQHYNELGYLIVDGDTNLNINTLEFEIDSNSIFKVSHIKADGKSKLVISNEPIVQNAWYTLYLNDDSSGYTPVGLQNLRLAFNTNTAETNLYLDTLTTPYTLLFPRTSLVSSNVWQKGETVTNSIPMDGSVSNNKIAPDAVTAISIAPNSVGSDELSAGAVISTKLSTNLFTVDIGLLGNAMFVKGLLNSTLPSKAGNAGKTLGLDNNSNWVFRAEGVGDMLEANYAKTNPAQYFVDKALFANRTTNTEGLLGYPAVTNGRVDNAVIVFSLANGRYQHISLSDLGGGDMFRSTYATNSIVNPGVYTGYVDKSVFSINSITSGISTNAIGLLGKPVVTNGRLDSAATLVLYNAPSNRYEHITLGALGGGDMSRIDFANGEDTNKVNQIAVNCITSNNIVNGSIATDDLKNFSVTPIKTSNIVTYTTSFASVNSDVDGTYSTLTIEKIQGIPVTFGETTVNHILAFAPNGSITSRVDTTISPSRTPHTLTIDGTSDSVSFGLSNNYYYINVNAKVTNWNITQPAFGDGVLYKLDMFYVTNTPFAWGGSVVNCTNLPSPPPVGFSSYIFEIIAGSTNFVAYP